MATKTTTKKVTKKEEKKTPREIFIKTQGSASMRIALEEYKGNHRIDFRKYTESERYTGLCKEGYCVDIEHIDTVIKALQGFKEIIQAEGLKNEKEEEAE